MFFKYLKSLFFSRRSSVGPFIGDLFDELVKWCQIAIHAEDPVTQDQPSRRLIGFQQRPETFDIVVGKTAKTGSAEQAGVDQ